MTRVRHTLRTATEIVDAGLAPRSAEAEIARVAERHAVAITPAMAELIDAKDAADPIARQFVPDVRELDLTPDERADPIGDHRHSPVRGIVHRYRDRVLLKIVGVCPVYCRFCFRREMVGPAADANLTADEIAQALAYIGAHPEIWEVILTGGDPLIMSPRRVAEITAALGSLAHVKIVRWHTRVPVVAPERVTADLVAALASGSKTVYVALHANHPRELTPLARDAIGRIADAGIPVVSQSVLLRGVNDNVETLEALMRAFVEARVKPYYLHHGDLAPGTEHFRTSLAEGQALARELRRRVSGLAMPTYMLDIPGGHGKVPAEDAYVDAGAGTVIAPSGAVFRTDGSCAP
ncbi:MAG: lysine-2,3-aminomutase-like protein [Hyphomicrobium sp.]|uniref:lysine-2,3-aminomutase-like protein n=1 Tax=Hyphomicrobium sp. TaxID=82 RepID=UPI003D0E1307